MERISCLAELPELRITSFSTSTTLFNLANNLATNDTQDFYLRLTMPSDTSSANQHSAVVTIVATAP